MKYKPLLFSIVLTLVLVAIIKIPIGSFFTSLGLGQYTKLIHVLTKAFILAIVIIFVTKRTNLAASSGITNHTRNNYWMLVLPILYPGVWTFSNASVECLENMHTALILIFTVLILASMEEFVFRGLIQGYLIKYSNWNIHKSILATNILFATGHFINLTHYDFGNVLNQVVYAFFVGMLLSAVQVRVNNVFLLGIAHGILNLLYRHCAKQEIYEKIEIEVEPSLVDYLASVASIVIMLSPTLMIYWALMHTRKKTSAHPTDASGDKSSLNV